MDEEQALASPIAGGIRAVRRTVSSSVLSGRQAPVQPPSADPQTVSLLSQNAEALSGINIQLAKVTEQLGTLSNSLGGVQQSLAVNESLERQREQQKQRRDAAIAEQGLREGKESAIEKKIQSALLKPVKAVATKVQGVLGRIGQFLFAIGAGWLTDKVLKFFTLKSEGNADLLRKFKVRFLSDLLLIGGIFTIFTGAMGKLLLSTKVLGLAFSKLAFTGLLTLPLVFLFSYIGNTLNKLKLLVEGKLGLVPTDRVENQSKLAEQATVTTQGAEVLGFAARRAVIKNRAIRKSIIGRPLINFGKQFGKNLFSPLRIALDTIFFGANIIDRKNQGETNFQAIAGSTARLGTIIAATAAGTAVGGPFGTVLGLVGAIFLPDQVEALVDSLTGATKTREEKRQKDKNKETSKGDTVDSNTVNPVDQNNTSRDFIPISSRDIVPIKKDGVNIAQSISNMDNSSEVINIPMNDMGAQASGLDVAVSGNSPSQFLRDLAVRNSENVSIFTSGAFYNMNVEGD